MSASPSEPEIIEPSLRADCGQCAALCCAYHAFDRSEQFAIDKPAGVPCPNLSGQGRCTIHASLVESGFPGCAAYDCLGAGQHVVQGLFGGRSWQADPTLKTPMFEAFRAMRLVHELLSLLRTARQLPLAGDRLPRISELERELLPAGGWTAETLKAFEAGPVPGRVRDFLRTLRDSVPDRPAARLSA
jgi:hypothetical protein